MEIHPNKVVFFEWIIDVIQILKINVTYVYIFKIFDLLAH